MANLSNINNKFLFTDGDFLLIGGATANSISATESGVAIKNSNAATLSLQNSATNGKNHTLWSNTDGSFNITDVGVATRFTIASGGDVYFPETLKFGIGTTSIYPQGSDAILKIYSASGGSRLYLQSANTGTAITDGSQIYIGTSDLTISNAEGETRFFNEGSQMMNISKFDGSANANPLISSNIRIWTGSKTGWLPGDILSKIEFYSNDVSGIGARNAASIRAVNEDGNGSTTTTFSGALAFYTSALNSTEQEAMRIGSSGTIISTKDGAGLQTNLLLSNLNDTNGDATGIGFSMLNNNTYVKGGMYFERKTTQGRGDIVFVNNNEVNGNNATLSDERMRITNGGVVQVGTIPGITPAILTVRKNGTCIEFGHGNNSGRYEGTLGVFGSNGSSYIGFATSCDSSVNTFTTRGAPGNVINGDNNGNLIFYQVTNSNASGQTPTERMRIASGGYVGIANDNPGSLLSVGSISYGSNARIDCIAADSQNAEIRAYGNSQGTGVVYVGQSTSYGGGIAYNGDGSPAYGDFGTDRVTLFGREAGTSHKVADWSYSSSDKTVNFYGSIEVGEVVKADKIYSRNGSWTTTGSAWNNVIDLQQSEFQNTLLNVVVYVNGTHTQSIAQVSVIWNGGSYVLLLGNKLNNSGSDIRVSSGYLQFYPANWNSATAFYRIQIV